MLCYVRVFLDQICNCGKPIIHFSEAFVFPFLNNGLVFMLLGLKIVFNISHQPFAETQNYKCKMLFFKPLALKFFYKKYTL